MDDPMPLPHTKMRHPQMDIPMPLPHAETKHHRTDDPVPLPRTETPELNRPNMSFSSDGGMLFECDFCPWAVCCICIEVPEEHRQTILADNIEFTCVSCHFKARQRSDAGPYLGFTLGGQPMLPMFLKVKGHFEMGAVGQVLCPTTLLMDLYIIDIEIKAHVTMIQASLQDFFPKGGFHSISILFNLGTDDATLLPSYQQVVIVVMNHTDEDMGDMFVGVDETGKGHSAEVNQFLNVLWPPFKHLLDGAIVYFASCGSLVNNMESLTKLKARIEGFKVKHAVAFDSPHLQTMSTAELLTCLMKRVVLYGLNLMKVIKDILPDMSDLGHHSSIIHFPWGSTSQFNASNVVFCKSGLQSLPVISKLLTTNINKSEADQLDDSEVEDLAIQFDGLKINYQQEYEEENQGESDLDIDGEIELEFLQDVKFGWRLAKMVEKEDQKDADWILRAAQLPDTAVMDQGGAESRLHVPNSPISTGNPTEFDLNASNEHQVSGRPRSATVLSDPSTDEADHLSPNIGMAVTVVDVQVDEITSNDESESGLEEPAEEDGGDELEDWEDELHESVAPMIEICDWETLPAQIQLDLKKKQKKLPLSQINQLMILSNFAMLRMKGAT
ncbi:hypothetical protein V8E55_009532 [Tylopilus felleus]